MVEDIERRQLEIDLEPAYARRQATTGVVFKTKENGLNGGEAPLFSADQIDAIAQAMAGQRDDIASMVDKMIAPLRERIVTLEARVETLLVAQEELGLSRTELSGRKPKVR